MSVHYNSISVWRGVTEEEWSDWKWQIANRITSVNDLEQVVSLTEKERQGINCVWQNKSAANGNIKIQR